jgi:hypothetical protein
MPEPEPRSSTVSSGCERGEVEEVADAGEGVDRGGGDPVELLGRVAQALGERAAGLEVKLTVGLARDFVVHLLDALLELGCVELGGAGGAGHAVSLHPVMRLAWALGAGR